MSIYGWICSKCGRSYSPSQKECLACNADQQAWKPYEPSRPIIAPESPNPEPRPIPMWKEWQNLQCAHLSCVECRGTGRKRDGSTCIHMLFCTCPRCNTYNLLR